MAQSLTKNAMHLIFSTKNRRAYLSEKIRPSLHRYMATVLKNKNSSAIIINSVEDHVHILFLLHRAISLSKAVGELKQSSSKWLKAQDPELNLFSWQAGYGAFSVSESSIPSVKTYIVQQEEHHAKISFKDELRNFLQKHEIEYDERYLWD